MNNIRNLVVAATIGALTLAGCTSPDATASSEDNDSPFQIGLVNPTSGATAFAGVPIQRGAETAIQEINDTGYLGEHTLELIATDSRGEAEREISLYRGLVADGVLAAVCCTLSASSGSFGTLATRAEVPTVVNGATLPSLIAPPWLFRTVVLPATEGGPYDQVIDQIVAEAPEVESAVIITTADSEGQVNDLAVWVNALERNGVNILGTIDTFAEDTDFSVPASSTIALAPDLVVANMQGPKSASVVRALRDRGFSGLAVSSYGVAPDSVFDAGGEAMDGLIFPLPFSPLAENERTQRFVELYEEQHGHVPDLYSAQGYNAVWFIAQAIRDVDGPVDRASVSAAMGAIDTFESASGNVFRMVDGQAVLEDDTLVLQWNANGTQSLWPPEQ